MGNFRIEGNERVATAFQLKCMTLLSDVLTRHGIPRPVFAHQPGDWFLFGFWWQEVEYQLEVYPDMVVMHQEPHYYEPYSRAEWSSEDALIAGFADRLDRLLSGGSWIGPDEKRIPQAIKNVLRKLFRR